MGEVLCTGCGKVNSTFNLVCAGCGTPLPDTMPMPARPAAAGIAPGARIGKYLVEEELGRGGMGVVYAALDVELDRRVAIKMIGGDTPSAELRARFVREAQAMAKLAHPNVVVVHEYGTFADHLFAVMEHVDGVTLKAWLEKGAPTRRIVDVLVQAGRGLAAAHAAGIVHRDFKPTNVMVGADGRARVLDFGLASFAGADGVVPASLDGAFSPLSPALTVGVVGTPAYLSPELVEGARADARSDQFSYCVTVHEALCGERPYHYSGAKLVRRPPRDLPLPARARRALLRGLSARPEDRFPAMEPLLEELGVDAGRTRRRVAVAVGAAVIALGSIVATRAAVVAPPDPCTGSEARLAGVWDPARRDAVRAAFAATALPYADRTLAAVIAALDGYATEWAAEHRQTCAATAIHHEQSPEALDLRMSCLERRRRELEAVVTTLAAADAKIVDRADNVAGTLVPLAACRDTAALAAVARPDDPAVRARVDELDARLASAWARLQAGKEAEGLAALHPLAADADATQDVGVRARALRMLGNAQIENELAAAEATLLEALTLAEESRQDDLRADVLRDLVNLHFFQKRYADVHVVARMARRATRHSRDSGRADHFTLFLVEAQSYEASGQRAAALGLFEAARAMALTRIRPSPIRLVNVEGQIANHYAHEGRQAEARAILERSLVTAIEHVGEVHPTVARIHNNIGTRCVDLKDLACAATHFKKSLELKEKIYGPESIVLASGLINLGGSFVDQGRLDEAEPLLRRGLAIVEKHKGPDDELASFVFLNLGNLASRRGDDAQALPLYERALRIREAKKVLAPVIAEARFAVATALWGSRHDPHARKLALEARAAYAAVGGDYAVAVGEIDAWLATTRK